LRLFSIAVFAFVDLPSVSDFIPERCSWTCGFETGSNCRLLGFFSEEGGVNDVTVPSNSNRLLLDLGLDLVTDDATVDLVEVDDLSDAGFSGLTSSEDLILRFGAEATFGCWRYGGP
jgi:hypothetical protein